MEGASLGGQWGALHAAWSLQPNHGILGWELRREGGLQLGWSSN